MQNIKGPKKWHVEKVPTGEGLKLFRCRQIGQSGPTTNHQSVYLDGWMSVDRKTHFYQVIAMFLVFFYLPTDNPLTICMNVLP
jgi:hypothetical protein